MDSLTILREAHSGLRWLLLLAMLAALLWSLRGLLARRAWDRVAEGLMQAFRILISLQWLLGLVFFLALRPESAGHAITMTLATVLAELGRVWRRRADDGRRYLPGVLTLLIVAAMIGISVALLPGGWAPRA